MTFDLATLDTAKVAEEGAELLVSHPTTGEDLGIKITLIGTDSKTFRDISKIRATMALKKKTREIDLDQNEQDSIELLARCTKGWSGITENGKDIPIGHENAVELYTKNQWLREQIDRFMADRSNFLPSAQKAGDYMWLIRRG